MRMIDADALRDNLQALAYDDWNQGVTTSWADAYSEVADMVEEMPTIEERKTGKWIHTDTQAGYDINGDLVWADMMKCETCGFEIDVIQGHIAQYNYCPSCGAEMDF